ncbi:hypothetical protein PR048_008129 [Dryococelus australis]|uniref:Uncharacterized protein n=1 Tax=Dryococelus australis TaxID=614101 RepID=A0ABQ9HWJ0_9NEOP|nr:hypothetical protein PR048_008129 [Dryococelus australis]
MCFQSYIPIHKLDHPAVREYFAKHVSRSGNLPSGSALRKNYVPACGENMKLKVKATINDQPIVIVADETSDSNSRCLCNFAEDNDTNSSARSIFGKLYISEHCRWDFLQSGNN